MTVHPTLARAYCKAGHEASIRRRYVLGLPGDHSPREDAEFLRLNEAESRLYLKLPAHLRAAIQDPSLWVKQ